MSTSLGLTEEHITVAPSIGKPPQHTAGLGLGVWGRGGLGFFFFRFTAKTKHTATTTIAQNKKVT